jgi:MSHA pilin protein MshD
LSIDKAYLTGVPRCRQRGLTFIELIMFIMIVSIGLTGVLVVLNVTTRSSADPMIRKQMLAIAEGVMEEVSLQPFTWCDPNDPNAALITTTTAAGCTSSATDQATTAPTAGESRGSATVPFDNVADYNGAAITQNIAGTGFPPGYSATVAVTPVTPAALGPAGSLVPAGAALLITVTVTHGADTLVIEGYRTRYAPNAVP